jgi:helix-turn-helix protein
MFLEEHRTLYGLADKPQSKIKANISQVSWQPGLLTLEPVMAMIRTHHNRENPYVRLNKKALWDEELSLEAVGLWAGLLSRPDDWQVSVIELSKSCKCGRDKIYKLLNELIKAGYAYRCQPRVDGDKRKNVFGAYDTHVFEFKVSPDEIKEMFPLTCFPLTEIPVTGKADTTKKELTNTSSPLRYEEKESSEGAKAPDPLPPPQKIPEEAKELATDLFSKVKKVHPKVKEPNFEKWEKIIDVINRIDKRSWQEIKEMMSWAFDESDFWYKQIQSPEALRKHWDKMAIQRSSYSNKSTVARKNRLTAQEIKSFLTKAGKGNNIWIENDFVRNNSTGDCLNLDLPSETFETVLFKWFNISRK